MGTVGKDLLNRQEGGIRTENGQQKEKNLCWKSLVGLKTGWTSPRTDETGIARRSVLSSERDETGPEIDRTKTINKNDPKKTGETGQERDQKDCEKEGETDPETGGIGPEIGSP